MTSNRVLDAANSVLSIRTPTIVTSRSERYYIQDYGDVLYNDIPYCSSPPVQGRPKVFPPTIISLAYKDTRDASECRMPIQIEDDTVSIEFIKVL